MTNKTPQSFVYPEIKDQDYVFGSGEVLGNVLAFDGDWRPFLPPPEHQRRNGIESSSCFIEAQQHAIATILERQYGLLDQNFSARFNHIFSEATLDGGDPLKGAQTFRDYGLISDTRLPFSDLITNWHQFSSFFGGDRDECLKAGIEWLAKWNAKYDIVVRREMDIETKYKRLKEGLLYSPLPFSVAAGYDNGRPKPKGATDIHLIELAYVDSQYCPYVFDTYPPFIKKLAPFYDTEFAMRLTVEPNTIKEKISLITRILAKMYLLLSKLKAEEEAEKNKIKVPFYWNTPALARNSVRLICDEMELSEEDKELITAVIACESGFKTLAVRQNTDKRRSKDYGICQYNSYWYIGAGKPIPSVEVALGDPEFCVRAMIKQFKRGQLKDWVCYSKGLYKKYLTK